jgi:hypothetical protein
MRRHLRRTLKLPLLALLLALGVSVVLTGPAGAAPSASTAVTQQLSAKTATFGEWHAGDCTRFAGATWTLYSDGTAFWDATVTSSDDNDAWLMWVHLKDGNGAELGMLENTDHQNPNDRYEFIKDLPDHTQRYRWFGHGWFDPSLFSLIQNMSLDNRC